MSRRTQTKFIVVHCSATRPSQNITAQTVREWHVAKGWSDIGYHFFIRRDGTIEPGRHPDEVGAHVAGHNTDSVAICLAGGLDESGGSFANRPDLFTQDQWKSAELLVSTLRKMYPQASVCGHRDLSPDLNHDGKIQPHEWLKTCPGFDAQHELGGYSP
jgi:N-acetylmuramoyl-L-alanine amidase